jgi:hypothetical protein
VAEEVVVLLVRLLDITAAMAVRVEAQVVVMRILALELKELALQGKVMMAVQVCILVALVALQGQQVAVAVPQQ